MGRAQEVSREQSDQRGFGHSAREDRSSPASAPGGRRGSALGCGEPSAPAADRRRTGDGLSAQRVADAAMEGRGPGRRCPPHPGGTREGPGGAAHPDLEPVSGRVGDGAHRPGGCPPRAVGLRLRQRGRRPHRFTTDGVGERLPEGRDC